MLEWSLNPTGVSQYSCHSCGCFMLFYLVKLLALRLWLWEELVDHPHDTRVIRIMCVACLLSQKYRLSRSQQLVLPAPASLRPRIDVFGSCIIVAVQEPDLLLSVPLMDHVPKRVTNKQQYIEYTKNIVIICWVLSWVIAMGFAMMLIIT